MNRIQMELMLIDEVNGILHDLDVLHAQGHLYSAYPETCERYLNTELEEEYINEIVSEMNITRRYIDTIEFDDDKIILIMNHGGYNSEDDRSEV